LKKLNPPIYKKRGDRSPLLISPIILFSNHSVKRTLGISLEAVAMPLLMKSKVFLSREGSLKACSLAESLTEKLGCLLLLIEGTNYFF
jgi:hypothetical protein